MTKMGRRDGKEKENRGDEIKKNGREEIEVEEKEAESKER